MELSSFSPGMSATMDDDSVLQSSRIVLMSSPFLFTVIADILFPTLSIIISSLSLTL